MPWKKSPGEGLLQAWRGLWLGVGKARSLGFRVSPGQPLAVPTTDLRGRGRAGWGTTLPMFLGTSSAGPASQV